MMETDLWTRRALLRTGGAFAAGMLVPGWLSGAQPHAARRSARPTAAGTSLVVCCLAGGNDGLNTVIPYRNPEYYRMRPSLAIPASEVLPLTSSLGLHPALVGLKSLYDAGRVAIVSGVGYPGHHRSHYRSVQAWQSGRPFGPTTSGWLGRHLDSRSDPVQTVHMEPEVPLALASDRPDPAPCEARRPSEPRSPFADDPFGRAFCTVADVIQGSPEGVLAHISVGGFDTHTRQAAVHAQLLSRMSDALVAFQQVLESSGRAEQTLMMVYSEFGRSAQENASQGTDHGQAGPVLLVGSKVHGGLIGDDADLAHFGDTPTDGPLDFRRVYATLLDQWLGGYSKAVLGERFEHLPLIRA